MNSKKAYVEVAISLPVDRTFFYSVPDRLESSIQVGKRVLVPFRSRRVTGYVLGFPRTVELTEIKEIIDILDEEPLFSKSGLKFLRWVAEYYFFPLGEVLKTALPGGINIESYQHISITQKGKEVLGSLDSRELRAKILSRIAETKKGSLRQILKRFSGKEAHHTLHCLRKDGLVSLSLRLSTPKAKPKMERIVVLREEPSPVVIREMKEKAPGQWKLYQMLKEKKEMYLSSLTRETGSAASVLKRLEQRGLLSLVDHEVYRSPFFEQEVSRDTPHRLTHHQRKALEQINRGLSSRNFSPFLIYGITGSGKTEVYLQAIAGVLSSGGEALVLVPEISLTPQLVSRFRARFGDDVAVLHSSLSEGERYDEWRRIKRGEVRIAIGARSAIFAPFENLRIIVVDEEHDSSYKQEERLKYNARDLAVLRAKLSRGVVVLGSATPSLESYYNAVKEKFTFLKLPDRIGDSTLPAVELVDLKEEWQEKGKSISPRLREAIDANLAQRGQAILFLNRRGFAPFVLCRECGYVFDCPNCSVSLIYHFQERELVCHYCNHSLSAPTFCPNCKGVRVELLGLGTERLEEEIKGSFPEARADRMDRDTTARKHAHQMILERFNKGEVDILIGTQMVTKGLDYPNVTLVGVISADLSLNFPDFRASERTFQLLTQVAGRAGRGKATGKVIIQSFNPDHYSIQFACQHDYQGFY
ncbi:MAG: primosomal protein N', partial [Deltaproteobacteria bacterium]